MRKSLLLSLISLLAIANVWAQEGSESTESATLINGIYYVLHNGTKTASVSNSNPGYTSTEQTYSGDIIVPSKVKRGSIDYTVTEIGDFAFESQYKIKSVDIPATVTKIGMMALYKNIELTSITCRAIVPPATSTEAESIDYGICYEVPLYVPAESVEAYKAADTWKLFRNILPIGTKIVNVSDMWYILNPDKTATFVAPLNYAYYEGNITLPSTVNYVSASNAETKSESNEYTVTSIGDKALAEQSGIVSVTLPETIKSLGSAIFNNCTSLTKIICKATTPPTAINGADAQEAITSRTATKANATATFDDRCFNNVQLDVPLGSLEAYKNIAPWNNFKSIVAIEISGITNNILDEDMGIRISGCNLYADGKHIQIYDTTGRIIYNGNTEVTLQRGIYIVKVGNRSTKVKF